MARPADSALDEESRVRVGPAGNDPGEIVARGDDQALPPAKAPRRVERAEDDRIADVFAAPRELDRAARNRMPRDRHADGPRDRVCGDLVERALDHRRGRDRVDAVRGQTGPLGRDEADERLRDREDDPDVGPRAEEGAER